jgi:hypothetical protein
MTFTESMAYVVRRGAEIGVTLSPHKHDDGSYVASKTRFERDYIRVESLTKLVALAKAGYKVRMSARDSKKHRAPSLISPRSIVFRRGAVA